MMPLHKNTFWTNFAEALLLAILGTVPILMSSLMDRGFEIAKHSLAEPFAFLALASVVLAGGWRWIGQAPLATRIAVACLTTFLVLAAISTLLSENPAVSVFGGYYRREGLLAWASYIAFFFAVLGWASARGTARLSGLLDLMLLASVIPAGHAIQQRLGMDFFFVVNLDISRPNGTLGNPIFLGAYLALLLPLTIVRGWQQRRGPALLFWLAVGGLQLSALLLTQSRGPVLAFLLGALLLAALAAGFNRSQKVFVAISMLVAATLTILTLINTQPATQRWAQEVPVLSRLVYNLESGASSAATSLASRSTAARLGIWEAATDTFVEAPTKVRLLGFGPESSYTHYFPHLPNRVMQVEGYWQSNTYDRYHADTLDIALNYGLLGWLAYCGFFAVVVLAAGRALFGFTGAGVNWLFFAMSLAGAAAGAGLARWAGLPSTMAPAAGLGIGGAWLLFLMACAWRAARCGLPDALRSQALPWTLLAGLTASLLVFWLDAQVNIPVLTTRLISFGVGALILAVAALLSQTATPEASEAPDTVPDGSWVLVLPLVAACASFLPAMLLDPGLQPKGLVRWWLFWIPIGVLLCFAAWRAWTLRSPGTGGVRVLGQALVPALAAAAVYALGHWALAKRIGPVIVESDVGRLAVLGGFGALFLLGFCLMRARKTAIAGATPAMRGGWLAASPLLALAVLAGWFSWIAIRADVASGLANWAARGQPEVSDRILLSAIGAMPHERQYQRQRTFEHLGRAMGEINRRGATAENFAAIRHELTVAEQQARPSVAMFPNDPWILLALANTLQIRGLAVLRPLAPAEGLAAAQEADRLFARAYEISPNQPLLLRNWAQLRFNEGDFLGAFQLIDRMEDVIPNEVDPYAERIGFLKRINELDGVRLTLVRAESRLEPAKMAELRIVAGLQQK
jgi:tetratricopeptide (TPR) repeat protein